MESLLHWDFAPGLALADQVRRQFGSTVHFSPSRDIKEFFLVVSFSSASFSLSVESVGVALQCCIGGISSGFNVLPITHRSFCFSVANNKVGHFIYGLKDRIWPDFVCHFHLFNGRFAKALAIDNHWHADQELYDIADRRSIAVKPSLQFLSHKEHLDHSSAKELSKFGLIPLQNWNFSNKDAHEASSSSGPSVQIQNLTHIPSIPPCDILGIASAPASDHIALMNHYLSQVKSEENQDINYLLLGTLNVLLPCLMLRCLSVF